jgi:uncharacterized membrane protein
LRPNRSWTWRSNLYCIAALMAISTTVATTFAWHGFWLVLPFTALEMSALFACLYVCVRRTHAQEVLIFSSDELIVETGHRRPEHIYRFARFFARFRVERTDNAWHQDRVAIQVRDQRLEIGRFLSSDDKVRLIEQLRLMVHRFA